MINTTIQNQTITPPISNRIYTEVNVHPTGNNEIITNTIFIGGFDFGSIPPNSTITNISVIMNRRFKGSNTQNQTDKYVFDNYIAICKNVTIPDASLNNISNNYAQGAGSPIPLSFRWDIWPDVTNNFQSIVYPPFISYPNYEPLWGFSSVTIDELCNPYFGILFNCKVKNSTTISSVIPQIECMKIAVNYIYDEITYTYSRSIFMDNNIKFDTEISNFGKIDELIFSKVNENGNIILKINQDKDTSMYPMIDEYGYLYNEKFIFKSPWDREFFTRTNTGVVGNFVKPTVTLKIPTVTTNYPGSPTHNSVTCGGIVNLDGGSPVTERGICWSENISPSISDSHTSDGYGTGNFNSNITGLNSGTDYYIRAYATNIIGTGYGAVQHIKTITFSKPIVITSPITILTSSTFKTGGNVTYDGNLSVISRGVCWGTMSNPTTSNNHTHDGNGDGIFISNITGLTSGITYYVRAYAVNSQGVSYGDVISHNITKPIVVTISSSNVTKTNAIINCNVISSGSTSITDRGISFNDYCFNDIGTQILMPIGSRIAENQNEDEWMLLDYLGNIISSNVQKDVLPQHGGQPLDYYSITGNKVSSTTNGVGLYSVYLTGLTSGITYNVIAYATNIVGTSYGSEINFMTTVIPYAPTITTTPITEITTTGATSGGDVISDGGVTVITKGICWNTSPNPTTSDFVNPVGSGTGNFVGDLTSLSFATLYYVRAYAINSIGTSYGNQFTFTTSSLIPSVTTSSITNISSNTAISGGNIISTGGGVIIDRGVCWGTSTNPTILNPHTSNGTGYGIFVSNLTGLINGTNYYVRAYATNSTGTAYGNERTFTTILLIPTVTTSSVSISGGNVTCGGNVTSQGMATVTSRGVCWSQSPDPVWNGGHSTIDGYGIGLFTSDVLYSLYDTLFYIRAYAINSYGVSYGDTIEFTSPSHP